MKKYIATLALVCILFSSIGITVNSVVYADDETSKYQDLLDEKNAYLAKYGFGGGETYYNFPYMEFCRLTVLLYTDAAKEFVFEKHEFNGSLYLATEEDWFYGFYSYEEDPEQPGFWLTSPQISEAIQSCIGEYGAEDLCALRACIQHFGISKEELIEANRKMQAEPESVRELLNFLTDEDFRIAKYENGLYCMQALPDFAIEALYMEDDAMAYRLLSKPYAIYVKEFGRMFTVWELREFSTPVNSFIACDLTSDAVADFIAYCEEKYSDDICYEEDGTIGRMSDRIAIIKAAREAQLKAAETGDGAVNALWMIALSVPTLAAVVWVKRKRRI